jgi:hypothetical protein
VPGINMEEISPKKFFLKTREFVIEYFLILFEIENLQNFTQREN